ncbi:hypothetical protein N7486_003366 [Penicillium sp. IBT 16267x]|nr:hypothetical protein N7486_003366 [Penicillium sp. IBT 16267x]
MDIRPLPREKLNSYDELQIRRHTPAATIDKLRFLCIEDDMKGFQETIDQLVSSPQTEAFTIVELGDVMMEAIKQDSVGFVLKLLSHGFPIQPCYTLEATLHKAKGVLGSFIEAGWDINEPVGDIKPPVLSYAVMDKEMTTWLLDHGANPNKRCKIDCTPLSYAVQLTPISTIELMLSYGGDVQKGQLLQYAIFRATELNDVISLLVKRGAPLNATMHQDVATLTRFWPMSLGTPLHVAAELGKTDAIRHLITLGADTGVKDARGRTVVEWARELNQEEVVRLLEDSS